MQNLGWVANGRNGPRALITIDNEDAHTSFEAVKAALDETL